MKALAVSFAAEFIWGVMGSIETAMLEEEKKRLVPDKATPGRPTLIEMAFFALK